jgi:hypothetical protein
MLLLLPVLLAGVVDGEAALRHARELSALGPRPWGSPRGLKAAEFVEAKLREAGLAEVRVQEFTSHGRVGANVIGVLRAPGPEFVLVGAHHDTAPESPGAYDDAAGVGVLIEVARVFSREPARPRTLVFVSFDGEEAWWTGSVTTAGSREYVRALGPEARNLVAALVVEMCGWNGGTPVLHPIAYRDPMRPGRYLITPDWLIQAAQAGARRRASAMGVGDPYLSWLYQPAVRTFRVRLYGDDVSFLQAGLPALFLSDSSFSAFYPWYHQATDTADKIDAASLARVGAGVLGAVEELARVPRGPASSPAWFSAFGVVLGAPVLFAAAGLSLAPGLLRAVAAGGFAFWARLLHAGLLGLLLWRHPVPAVWVFLLPNLALAFPRRWWATLIALLPAAALVGLGATAWTRGMADGLWLAPWEAAAGALGLALACVRPPTARHRPAAVRKRGLPGR